jgi:hypothetical protein
MEVKGVPGWPEEKKGRCFSYASFKIASRFLQKLYSSHSYLLAQNTFTGGCFFTMKIKSHKTYFSSTAFNRIAYTFFWFSLLWFTKMFLNIC